MIESFSNKSYSMLNNKTTNNIGIRIKIDSSASINSINKWTINFLIATNKPNDTFSEVFKSDWILLKNEAFYMKFPQHLTIAPKFMVILKTHNLYYNYYFKLPESHIINLNVKYNEDPFKPTITVGSDEPLFVEKTVFNEQCNCVIL